MTFIDLPAAARRAGKRRSVALAPIWTTQEQARRLYRVYARVVEMWRAGFTALLPTYSATVRDTVEEFAAGADRLADEAARLIFEATVTGGSIETWAVTLEAWHRAKFVQGAYTASGVELSAIIGPAGARRSVAEAVQWNTSLIRDVSESTRQRIANAFFEGFRARKPAREIGKAINEAAGIGRKRANRIAADQTVKLSASLDEARRVEQGINKFQWRHSHKKNFRPEHKARNLRIYSDTNRPIDMPGQLPFCGCVAAAWLDLDD